jgi:hypothetical protein
MWGRARWVAAFFLAVLLHYAALRSWHLASRAAEPRTVEIWRGSGGSGRAKKGGGKARWKRLPASAFALSATPASRLGMYSLAPGGDGAGIGNGSGDGRGEAEGALRGAGLDRRLYDLIDEALTYPGDLADHGVEGMVSAKLFFHEDGRYDRVRSRIESSSPFLKVFIVRLLRSILSEGIPSLMPERKEMAVRCSFEFAIDHLPIARRNVYGVNGGEQQVAPDESILPAPQIADSGRHLRFSRTYHALSQIRFETTASEDGVNKTWVRLDLLPWIEQGIEALTGLFSTSPKIDPLDKYRDDPEWRTVH